MKRLINISFLIVLLGLVLMFFSAFTLQFAPDLYFMPEYVMDPSEQIFMDLGRGLISFGLIFLFICLIFKIKRFSDFKLIPTLKQKWHFYVTTNFAFFFFIVAFQVYHQYESASKVGPNYCYYYGKQILFDTESVRGIIEDKGNYDLTTFVIVNAFLAFFLFSPWGEVKIIKSSKLRGIYRTFQQVMLLILILLFSLIYINFTLRGDFFSTPALLVLVYILLSLRSRLKMKTLFHSSQEE